MGGRKREFLRVRRLAEKGKETSVFGGKNKKAKNVFRKTGWESADENPAAKGKINGWGVFRSGSLTEGGGTAAFISVEKGKEIQRYVSL